MKKIIIVLLLLFLGITAIWVRNVPKEEYSIPINEMDIESVTIYYANENVAKNINSKTDVLVVADMLNGLSLGEAYEIDEKLHGEIEAGGLGFGLVFHLEDGTEWICAYYQTSFNGEGRFADGEVLSKVSNLNVFELWQSLSYPENKDFPSEEFLFPPVF